MPGPVVIVGVGQPFAPVARLWSDQHDLTLQITGTPEAGTRTVERATEHGLLLFHLAADDRLTGVSALGSAGLARDFKVAQRLVEPMLLADPANRLKVLLRQW